MAKKARSFKTPGKISGPAHEEGGVEAQAKGKPVAEIEGNERVFSKEDTTFIEQEVETIKAHHESGDIEGADKAAMDLGYAIAKMITKQDLQQPDELAETEAINNFSNGEDDF